MTKLTHLVPSLLLAVIAPLCLAQPSRPQDPPEGVAYRVVDDVKIPVPLKGGDAIPTQALAATLTLPDPATHGDGPYPGIVLVSGSGPQDRDSNIFGHKPFAVWAHSLTQAGIAVLRYDERGVGESTGTFDGEATTLDLADDVRAVMSWLRAHESVDSDRVGLFGHSEGGIIAQILAGDGETDPAFIVLIASPAVPGRELMVLQGKLIATATGVSDEHYAPQQAAQEAFFDALVSETPKEELEAQVRRLIDLQLAQQGLTPTAEQLDMVVQQTLDGFATPWMRTFIMLDPAEHLARATCPVLAVNGALDLQVDADQNLTVINRVLAERAARTREGGEPAADYTIVRAGGLNHLLQPAMTGSPQEYAFIPTTIDPATLAMVTAWIIEESLGD